MSPISLRQATIAGLITAAAGLTGCVGGTVSAYGYNPGWVAGPTYGYPGYYDGWSSGYSPYEDEDEDEDE